MWHDVDGKVHRKLHASHATLVLVRPDGSIGYRRQPADGTGLLEHLGRYLVRRG